MITYWTMKCKDITDEHARVFYSEFNKLWIYGKVKGLVRVFARAIIKYWRLEDGK